MTKICEKFDSHCIKRRASLRGIKKCPSCGCINGQRAVICCNTECALRQHQLARVKPFDPIQLMTYNNSLNNNNGKWFSVRCKERLVNPRNFVYIPNPQSKQNNGDSFTKTFCFVTSCKYDIYDSKSIKISCDHVNVCNSEENHTFQSAVPYTLDKTILWNLNIPMDQKQFLWNLYEADESNMPAVQCLNGSIFVVKCSTTKTFPAGRLHATIYPDSMLHRKGTFNCACKKSKSLNAPSTMLPYDLCNHILLIMVAILSQSDTKSRYKTFLDKFQYLWTPTSDSLSNELNVEIDSNLTRSLDSKSSLVVQSHFANELFNFNDELFSDCMLPDFSDIHLDIQNPPYDTNSHNTDDIFLGKSDTKLMAISQQISKALGKEILSSSLSNKDQSNIKNVCETNDKTTAIIQDQFDVFDRNQIVVKNRQNRKEEAQSLLKPLHTESINTTPQPQQTQQIIYVVANSIPPAISINSTQQQLCSPLSDQQQINNDALNKSKCAETMSNDVQIENMPSAPPVLTFDGWLKHVIEVLNDGVDIKDTPNVKRTFHVHEDIFSHFNKRFSCNTKLRLPNTTTIIKTGKYKDLMKYSWHFTQKTIVQKIFTTNDIKFDMERIFYLSNDGNFRRFMPSTLFHTKMKGRPIYPKYKLYTAFVIFNDSCNTININNICNINGSVQFGVKIKWVPKSFTKSQHGIMTIEFVIGVKQNPIK